MLREDLQQCDRLAVVDIPGSFDLDIDHSLQPADDIRHGEADNYPVGRAVDPADIEMGVADTHRLLVVRAMMQNLWVGLGAEMFAELVAAIGSDRVEYERLKILGGIFCVKICFDLLFFRSKFLFVVSFQFQFIFYDLQTLLSTYLKRAAELVADKLMADCLELVH